MNTSESDAYFHITPHAMDDRAYWNALRAEPRHAALFAAIEERAAQTPALPSLPTATDYLAAKRRNDREILDRHWADRSRLSDLALRRSVRGLEADDPDDRLLNWLWAFLTEPSWTVSAHLPGNDLPASGQPTLDLASCEMAALFAEMREVLKPWMDSVSQTLADSVLAEIDARVLGPYGDGAEVRWQNENAGINNWLGVCAGNILAACESLAAQGQPRPQARSRALEGLRLFLERGFTPHGECDEGLSYWVYGMGGACLGWSRLPRAELEANVDVERLRLIADYPRRIHLFGDSFFSGNDAGLRCAPPRDMIPWLAAATGVSWLWEWAGQGRQNGAARVRGFGHMLRLLGSPEPDASTAKGDGKDSSDPAAADRPQFLPDQQTVILRAQTPQGELLVALTGGSNAERHNHNDLGHFLVAVNEQWIVPDLGAPAYTADFFGPRRYTYLPASSRGHCCPLIGGFEQRPGAEAAGKVLSWTPDAAEPQFVLDLTAAYPPEAGLRTWRRSLQRRAPQAHAPAGMVLTDTFETGQAGEEIRHTLWSLEPPQNEESTPDGGRRLQLGPLRCELAPAPERIDVTTYTPEELRLREFGGQTLTCMEAVYRTDRQGNLTIETAFV